jgi:lipopolysaccharide transport system ATP-binding protein
MRAADIRRRFDQIVAFSGVERFIDTPLKRYSSGMQVRLGFAVAAHLDTDILIVDEVLAVGDAEFQRKCLDKMGDLSASGRTVLYVSHNMASVETLCDSAMLLESGHVAHVGAVQDVLEAYQASLATALQTSLGKRTDRKGSGVVRIVAVESEFRTGAESQLRLHFESSSPVSNVEVAVPIYGSNREAVALLGNAYSGQRVDSLPANGTLVCTLNAANLMPGTYTIDLYCTVNGIVADWIADAARVEIADGAYFKQGKLPPPGYGHVLVPQEWQVDGVALL